MVKWIEIRELPADTLFEFGRASVRYAVDLASSNSNVIFFICLGAFFLIRYPVQ